MAANGQPTSMGMGQIEISLLEWQMVVVEKIAYYHNDTG